jgi:hypothetical protein
MVSIPLLCGVPLTLGSDVGDWWIKMVRKRSGVVDGNEMEVLLFSFTYLYCRSWCCSAVVCVGVDYFLGLWRVCCGAPMMKLLVLFGSGW